MIFEPVEDTRVSRCALDVLDGEYSSKDMGHDLRYISSSQVYEIQSAYLDRDVFSQAPESKTFSTANVVKQPKTLPRDAIADDIRLSSDISTCVHGIRIREYLLL